MCGVSIVLTAVLGALYLTGVLAAVLVALVSSDRERRTDARKVLHLLLSVLPGFRWPNAPRRQRTERSGGSVAGHAGRRGTPATAPGPGTYCRSNPRSSAGEEWVSPPTAR